jgi:hypothetical protein
MAHLARRSDRSGRPLAPAPSSRLGSASGEAASVGQTIDAIGRLIAEAIARLGGAGMRPLGEARAYVLTRAITGAIRGAELGNSPLLRSREFKEELVHLALAYLRS